MLEAYCTYFFRGICNVAARSKKIYIHRRCTMPYNVYIQYCSLYIILICRKMCSTYLGHPFFNPHASLPKQQNKMVSECGYKTRVQTNVLYGTNRTVLNVSLISVADPQHVDSAPGQAFMLARSGCRFCSCQLGICRVVF